MEPSSLTTVGGDVMWNARKFFFCKTKVATQLSLMPIAGQGRHLEYNQRVHIPSSCDASGPICCALRKSSFPTRLKHHHVVRQTKTKLGNLEENIIEDNWNVDKKETLSDLWSADTRFRILQRRPRKGHTWVSGRSTKIQVPTRPRTNSQEIL